LLLETLIEQQFGKEGRRRSAIFDKPLYFSQIYTIKSAQES